MLKSVRWYLHSSCLWGTSDVAHICGATGMSLVFDMLSTDSAQGCEVLMSIAYGKVQPKHNVILAHTSNLLAITKTVIIGCGNCFANEMAVLLAVLQAKQLLHPLNIKFCDRKQNCLCKQARCYAWAVDECFVYV